MATIRDVAQRAGVSVSTVSLMINGKQNISDETYARIEKAMKELKYRPSIIAQNLKKRKFHIIGVVLPTGDGYYAQIIKGIYDAMNTDNDRYDLIVKYSGDNAKTEKEHIESLISMSVSGIIVVPCDTKDSGRYDKWINSGLHMVLIERRLGSVELSSVTFNNREVMYKKTAELLKRYRPEELALITGYTKFSNERDCLAGFKDAVKEKYPQFDEDRLVTMQSSFERRHCVWNTLERFGDAEGIKCFLTSSVKFAEILREVLDIIRTDAEVYALGGDVWFPGRKKSGGIHEIPREASTLGQEAAKLILSLIRTNRISEVRDIVIESKYNVLDPEPQKQIRPVRTKIKALLLETNEMEVLSKLTPNFVKETGIDVEIDLVPFFKIINMLTGPADALKDYDVMWVDIPLVEIMSRQGKLEKLNKWIEKEESNVINCYPRGVQKCVIDSRNIIYGLPVLMVESLLYYRNSAFNDPAIKRQFFQKNGFELMPPTTWPEFNIIAKFFDSRQNPDSPFRYGTSMSLIGHVFMEEFYIRQWAFNGSMFDKRHKLAIDSVENARALRCFAESCSYAHPESESFFLDETYETLLRGEVPMVINFPVHCIPYRHKRHDENIERDITVANTPGGHPLLGGWEFCINADSSKKEEAFQFLKWSIRGDLAVVRDLMGSMLPVKETFDNSLLINSYPEFKIMNVGNFHKGLRESFRDARGNLINQNHIETMLKDILYKAVTGEMGVEETLRLAHRTVEELVEV